MEVLGGLLVLAILVVAYFLPTFIAAKREHHNANAIFVANLLLGWTGLGWVATLVWALTAVDRPKSGIVVDDYDTRPCPYCAEKIKKAARVCRFCGRELAP